MLTKLSDVTFLKFSNYHIVEEVTSHVEYHFSDASAPSTNVLSIHKNCSSKTPDTISTICYQKTIIYDDYDAILNEVADNIQEIVKSLLNDIDKNYIVNDLIYFNLHELIINYINKFRLKLDPSLLISEFDSLIELHRNEFIQLLPTQIKDDIDYLVLTKTYNKPLYILFNNFVDDDVEEMVEINLKYNDSITLGFMNELIKELEYSDLSRETVDLYARIYVDNNTFNLSHEIKREDAKSTKTVLFQSQKLINEYGDLDHYVNLIDKLDVTIYEAKGRINVTDLSSKLTTIKRQNMLPSRTENLKISSIMKVVKLINHLQVNNTFSNYLLSNKY